jgi:hypothetical protein
VAAGGESTGETGCLARAGQENAWPQRSAKGTRIQGLFVHLALLCGHGICGVRALALIEQEKSSAVANQQNV